MVFGLKHLSWTLTKLRILPNSSKRSITCIKLFVCLLNCSLIYAILLNGEVNAAPIYLNPRDIEVESDSGDSVILVFEKQAL